MRFDMSDRQLDLILAVVLGVALGAAWFAWSL